MDSVNTNILAKYENLIKITDLETKKTATVSIVVRNFPTNPDNKELITVFIAIFTKALLISQSNNIQVYDVLVDCEGTTSKNINKQFGKDLIYAMKKVFNNTLGSCIIFNTNQLFKAVYTIFSPLIDKPTKKKIRVF